MVTLHCAARGNLYKVTNKRSIRCKKKDALNILGFVYVKVGELVAFGKCINNLNLDKSMH